jgi:plastocyanin
MKRMRLTASVVALALGAAGSAAAATHGTPKLVASVSDPFSISLTKAGKKVTSLKAGTYVIVVEDKAADHNFHLTGPGLNKTTSVAGKGTTRWTVKLKKGKYTYVCDPHKSFMKGSFAVG